MRYLCFLLIASSFSCGDDNQAIQKARFDEVMAIHDEIMPYMGTINSLKNQIQEKMAVIADMDTTGVGQSDKLMVLDELEKANEDMMDWMRNFSKPSEEQSHGEIMKYYDQQFEKISEVKSKILQAIDRGKSAVNQN